MQVPSIVVVGSVNADMVVKNQRLPAPGETITGGRFMLVPGGKGANQAVAAARLGAKVTLVAKIGRDQFGDHAIANFHQEGILTDWVFRDANNATGVALILVDDHGENLISVASGANHALQPADVEQAADCIRQADVVLVQLEVPLNTVEYAVRLASEAAVPVILDPAPAPDVPLNADLLSRVTYLKPNANEAERLTRIPVHDEASARQAVHKLLEDGARHVVITLGSQGALWASPHQTEFVPAHRVQVVDSTAAGDAFSGALAVALARGQVLGDAVRYANLVAAFSVTRLGAQPSLPTAEELDRFTQMVSKRV